ncbi:hypothetical protein ACLIMP_19130 [Novosphingobium aerophilum]|uniref:hypothetical protein n=1 Tax=Novosphingobium TaxID=165696 RepID=UPI0006C84982|nr:MULTISPECIES: hypothetical protein [unclassified Novosphingobium]KPH58091.1 hypothetical protein ADT71_26595 [Novosphingobium sp. ST904]MPS68045.1 hypothetical protein [Novosphingobium sp.]TCM41471.1 hypothetical protein EDF59_103223 [Novosphingobium sp. ST904]WRT95380.1 hypothetical protein U9J33_24710 [Novosphingobium sp. RL4]
MMLGDLLGMARRSAASMERYLAETDPDTCTDVRRAAAASAISATEFVRMAVADFSRAASEEDWATIMSAMRDGPDPGRTCLHAILQWRIAAPTCEVHTGGQAGNHGA